MAVEINTKAIWNEFCSQIAQMGDELEYQELTPKFLIADILQKMAYSVGIKKRL